MYISQTNSTNDWLKLHLETEVVWTAWQTAGRGQAGNVWESEEGKNILMSIRVTNPPIPVNLQFRMTMAVSLAVQKLVQKLLPSKKVWVKWPNDIYIDDKKVCGILIENTILDGEIAEAIIGIGLNVNQTIWYNGAPNPASIKTYLQTDSHLPTISDKLVTEVKQSLHLLANAVDLKEQYLSVLYRFKQKAFYAEREVSLTPTKVLTDNKEGFQAAIIDVTEQGELVLEVDQQIKKYHFKEVQFIL